MPDFDSSETTYGDDFDLPRFATRQPAHAHSAEPARHNPYGATTVQATLPPPPPLHSSYSSSYASQTPTGHATSRNRLSQIMSDGSDLLHSPGAGASLGRSASLGGPRTSRHASHPSSEDLERSFSSEAPSGRHGQSANSYYPSPIGYSTSTNPDQRDPGAYTPRRSLTQRTPHSSSYHDYNPPSSSYTDAYGGTTESGLGSPLKSPSSPATHAHHGGAPAQLLTPQHSPHLGPYHHSNSISAAFSTPPTLPPILPLHEDSPSLRPYSSRAGSGSTPVTPMSFSSAQSPQPGMYYSPRGEEDGGARPMSIDAQPPPAKAGFRRVRDARDLKPRVNSMPQGRRADPSRSGVYLSPLKSLTTHLPQTYNICNPQFRYETAHNPRRVLTKPSKPAHNEGYDNEDYDYILYVNDWLGAEEGHNKYLILDVLGQGTFGQVVKCQNMKTHEIVAVKVVKNKPAYFNQSMMEVTILELLNNTWDPHDEHHILRLRDTFIHRSHLCLVFELLSSNLYELIKQNSFGGLSTQLVKVFTAQLLDSLTVLNEAKLIHCDLKPENILLKSLQSPQIKVIDFGSACHERQTVYTYIQSRFYRSPEVLLGLSYTSAIDMWSLGCIAVELFLGLPLFPGTSEYNQITRIVEMVGLPPSYMLDMGKQTNQFFSSYTDEYGRKKYRLKTIEQFSREHGTQEQPGKKYFAANTLPDIIRSAPQPKSATKPSDLEKEAANRAAFIDFVQGLLNLNPIERWSPQQARLHPFITGEKFTRPYVPTDQSSRPQSQQQSPVPADPKRPYGGLVPSQPKGTRAYQDAASYNQHLAQHQAYTAQAASQQQAASQAIRNPYTSMQQQPQQPPPPPQQQQPQHAYAHDDRYPAGRNGDLGVPSTQPQHRLQHQASAGQLNTSPSSYAPQQQPQQQQQQYNPLGGGNPNPPSNSYYPPTRARANTINQMDTAVPPQLARIANLGMDVSGIKRNTLTPVLNREEAIKEWERRQSGQRQPPAPAYPQLEYLQQQAELASSSWNNSSSSSRRYAPSSLQHFQSPPSALVVDSSSGKHHQRDKSMSSSGLRDINMGVSSPRGPQSGGSSSYDSMASHPGVSLPAPPQVYSSNSNGRYGPPPLQTSSSAYSSSQQPSQSQQQSPLVPYDTFDHRDGLGTLYAPMQPNVMSSQSSASGSNGIPPSLNPSYYSGSSQQQQQQQQRNNPFSQGLPPLNVSAPPASHQADMWPR